MSRSTTHRLVVALCLAALAGLTALTTGSHAAAATLGVVARVETDGTATFDADDAAGHDSSATNARVRTNDSVVYRIDWNVNDGDDTSHTITAVLDAGMIWKTVPAACASGSISTDRHTLTCVTGDHHEGTNGKIHPAAFALPSNQDGTVATMTATVSATGSAAVTAPAVPVTITSVARMDLIKNRSGAVALTGQTNPHTGEIGTILAWSVTIAPEVASGATVKGAGPISGSFTFVEDMTGMTANSRLVDWGVPALGASGGCGPLTLANLTAPYGAVGLVPAATLANSVVDSGAWTCTPQGGNPRLVDVSVAGADTTPATVPSRNANSSIVGVYNYVVSGQIATFTPDSESVGPTTLTNRLSGFDPADLAGTPGANYGAGIEPTANNTQTAALNTVLPGTGANGLGLFNDEPQLTAWQDGTDLAATWSISTATNNGKPLGPNTNNGGSGGRPDNPYNPGSTFGIARPGNGQLPAGAPFTIFTSVNRSGLDRSAGNIVLGTCVTFDNALVNLDPTRTSYPVQIVDGVGAATPNVPRSTTTAAAGANGTFVVHQTQYTLTSPTRPSYVPIANNSPGSPFYDLTGMRIEYGTGGYASLAAQQGTTCADGDSTQGWSTDPASFAGGVADVTKVRIIEDAPPAEALPPDGTVRTMSRQMLAYIPVRVAPGAAPGTMVYALIRGGSAPAASPTAIAWTANGYDPNTHATGALQAIPGDRLFVSSAQATIDKASPLEGVPTSAGAIVPWTIDVAADGAVPNIVVTDTLPAGLTYVGGSASPAPTSIAGQVLTWNVGALTDATAHISYSTTVDANVVPGATLINPAQLSSAVNSAEDRAAVQTIVPDAEFAIVKSVLGRVLPVDTPLPWELTYANQGPTTVRDVDMIDVLPYNGDGGNTVDRVVPSNFVGSTALSQLRASAAGEAFYVTSMAPASISLDPLAPGNSLAVGNWCEIVDVSPTIPELGDPGCPATLAEATAFRFVSSLAMAPGEARTIGMVLDATDNVGGDVYANNFGGRVGDVRLPVISNDVSIRVVEPAITLKKYTNGVDADLPPGPSLVVGDAVIWTYVVTNTGSTALAAVAVTDDRVAASAIDCGGGTNVIALLVPAASTTCTATGTATVGQYANVGAATGSPVIPADPAVDLDQPSTWPTDPGAYTPVLDGDGDPLAAVNAVDPSHYVASTPVATSATSTTTTVGPTTVPAGPTTTSPLTPPPGRLPSTGAEIGASLAVGLVLLVGGAALVVLTRRRGR